MKTRFILIQTSHAGNVGAAARAMKVMGFDDLVLVAPRWANVLRREETIQRASGALDVLNNARIVQTTVKHELLLNTEQIIHAERRLQPDLAPKTANQAVLPDGVAFLFGSERFGMQNDDVYRCHAALSIPTNPQFGSLNLGAAVQLIAYDWREALGGYQVSASTPARQLADGQAVAGMLEHFEKALVGVGFLDPAAPKKLMPRLNQLFNRADLSAEDIHILRGVAKAMLKNAARDAPSTLATPPLD